MITLGEAVTLTGKSVLDHLDLGAEVPQIDESAAQGDVLVVRVAQPEATASMPLTVMVVESENSANTHTLHPSGECFWGPADRGTFGAQWVGWLVLGKLTVPAGSTALLSHQEHGAIEILPGTYEVRRQRELAETWRAVSD